jgi:hypothetical protein
MFPLALQRPPVCKHEQCPHEAGVHTFPSIEEARELWAIREDAHQNCNRSQGTVPIFAAPGTLCWESA